MDLGAATPALKPEGAEEEEEEVDEGGTDVTKIGEKRLWSDMSKCNASINGASNGLRQPLLTFP